MASVAEFTSKPFAEIASDANLRQGLVSLYSKLFEGGRPCRSCDSAIYGYYTKIQNMGAKREHILQLAKQRTCRPKFNGLRWVSKISAHIDTAFLHDEQAIELLRAGALSETDFDVLPIDYNVKPVVVAIAEPEPEPELEHPRNFADELMEAEKQTKRGRKAKQ